MLLSIRCSHPQASELSYLLHKRPDRVQQFALSFGRGQVYYPELSAQHCTAALLLEVDPVGLVRGGNQAQALEHYVNDRPYVASSFLSVAIGRIFGTALAGRCAERPELAQMPLPLTAELAAVPVRGGAGLLQRLFEPLGYRVTTQAIALDPANPQWGDSHYHSLRLQAELRLQDLLRHLYVLMPVLDRDKHYWVGDDEVDKLLRHGDPWLAQHPERELIVCRYLKEQGGLARHALRRLATIEETVPDLDAQPEPKSARAASLNSIRLNRVAEVFQSLGVQRIVDLGCGEGKLLRVLQQQGVFTALAGLDVSARALEIAARRLKLDTGSNAQAAGVQLLHGSLLYRDRRIEAYDGAALVEVIEHLEEEHLPVLERVVFEFARPRVVVLTTPNREYNVQFSALEPGGLRHPDHRFEWTRAEFENWADAIGRRFAYTVRFSSIGDVHSAHGAPTQMAIFCRTDHATP